MICISIDHGIFLCCSSTNILLKWPATVFMLQDHLAISMEYNLPMPEDSLSEILLFYVDTLYQEIQIYDSRTWQAKEMFHHNHPVYF